MPPERRAYLFLRVLVAITGACLVVKLVPGLVVRGVSASVVGRRKLLMPISSPPQGAIGKR